MMLVNEVIIPLSTAILITAFYVQGQAFISSMIRGQAFQSVLLAIISLIMGYLTGSFDYLALAVLIILMRAFLVTYLLERKMGEEKSQVQESRVNVAYLFLLSLIFIVISVFIVYSISFSNIGLRTIEAGPDVLVFPITLFFQGLFLIGSRRNTFAQIIGYIEEENAIVLLAVFLIPIPFLVEASAFLDVLALVVISSLVVEVKQDHTRIGELRG